MPLYKVEITLPFTVEAAGKSNIRNAVKKVRWQKIFNQLRSLGFFPSEMKYRTDIRGGIDIKKIKETGIS